MKKQVETITIAEVLATCKDAVQNALILEPKTPSAIVAERLALQTDPELLAPLGHLLLVEHFAKLVRSERMKQARAQRAQLALPGFEHLPVRIQISEKQRVPLHEATFTHVRLYYRMLQRKYRDQGRNNPKLKEAKALMQRMEMRARSHHKITVAQVLGVQAEA